MKICHVINTLNRGGAETHLFDLVEQQIKENYIVNLIIIGPDNNNIFSLEMVQECLMFYLTLSFIFISKKINVILSILTNPEVIS